MTRHEAFRAVWVLVIAAAPALGQDPPTRPMDEVTTQNTTGTCLEPPPVVRIEDYRGPLQKVVGAFARKLERKAVHAPHYKPGTMLCSLEPGDKLLLFVADTFDPISLLGVGFDAGLDQAPNFDPTFGQGAAGYGKRFAADFASQTSTRFFSEFAYPAIFSEDPRYYRLGHGKFSSRLWHALEHSVVAHRDDGRHMFNYSEWLGTTTGAAVNNFYHPGNRGGLGPIAQGAGYSILTDIGFDMLREFWPELARRFHMPFRGVNEPASGN